MALRKYKGRLIIQSWKCCAVVDVFGYFGLRGFVFFN